MTLYHLTEIYPEGIVLMQTEVVKETAQMYILKGDASSRWMSRINKDEVAYKGFHFSAKDAWNSYVSSAESQVAVAERRLEKAQEHLEKVKEALSRRKELVHA